MKGPKFGAVLCKQLYINFFCSDLLLVYTTVQNRNIEPRVRISDSSLVLLQLDILWNQGSDFQILSV